MSVCLTHSYTQKHTHPTHSLTLSPLSSSPSPPLIPGISLLCENTGERRVSSSTNRTGSRPSLDHALLVRFVASFNYANEVTAKVIIPDCSLQSPLSQTLLRQLAHSQSHGCLVGGGGGREGQRQTGMFRRKRMQGAVCERGSKIV